mgnify:CR=1 FL=1
MSIRRVAAPMTYPLRRTVLRKGIEHTDVRFPQDDMPDTFHLGYFVADELVGVASFSPAPTPHRPDAHAWQLRGMAVADDQQGKGVGAALVAEAIARVRADGAAVLWCNARDSASTFYGKLGFVTHGDGFATKDTGLPHHVMVLDL